MQTVVHFSLHRLLSVCLSFSFLESVVPAFFSFFVVLESLRSFSSSKLASGIRRFCALSCLESFCAMR